MMATKNGPGAKQTNDNLRIKKMYAALAKAAVSAITKESAGDWNVSASLRVYAELHADFVAALRDADAKQTAVATRKTDARFEKLVRLHNNFVVHSVDTTIEATRAKIEKLAKSSKPSDEQKLQKLYAERDAVREIALKASGIGDRKIPRV